MCEVMQKYMAQERAKTEAAMAQALRESGVPEEKIQEAIRRMREQSGRS